MADKSTIGKVMSDLEIEEMARGMVTPQYNAAIQGLDQNLETFLSNVGGAQEEAQRRVTDSAIRRGMGRSSRTTYDMSQALNEITKNVGLYTQQIEQQKNRLGADYETNVLNNVYKLRQDNQALWLALQNRGGGRGGRPPQLTAAEIFAGNFNMSGAGAGAAADITGSGHVDIVGPYQNSSYVPYVKPEKPKPSRPAGYFEQFR